MFRRKLQHRPTHWVVRKLLRATEQAAVRRDPTPYLQPWAWLTRRRLTTFETRGQVFLKELMIRYRGVITEYLFLKGITSRVDVQSGLDGIWRSFYIGTYRLASSDRFSYELWRAVQTTGVSANVQIKRKFMLRQFVEEVPRRKGRETLRRLAFDRDRGAPEATTEDVKRLKGVYPSLHRALLKWGSRLDEITDGAVEFETLSGFKPPYAQYHTWLFENDDDQGH